MLLNQLISKLVRQRIRLIIAGTAYELLILSLLFYSLFLLLPSLFIKAGLISLSGLIIILIIILIISIIIYIYKYPFFNRRLLKDVIKPPYNDNDLKSALELERGNSFPDKRRVKVKEKRTSEFLSKQYIKKIQKHIKPHEKIYKEILPDIRGTVFCIIVIIVSAVLTYSRSQLVGDVYAALKTGLPVELVSINPPVRFSRIEALIIPPAYFDSESASSVDLNRKSVINVMQGSGISLKGTIGDTRYAKPALKSGRIIMSAGGGVEYFPISINDKHNFEASFLAPSQGAFALEFDFSTGKGKVISGKSKIFSIKAMPDQPPAIKILFPPENYTLVFGNPVEISYAATDDHGIQEILLYHRNPEAGKDFQKELITRFPKEPKKNYSSTYVWNPVAREGDKTYELVYLPSTKTVEYFLEVRDTNSFSSGGIARTGIRQIHFTDMFSNLNSAVNIIQELISDGRKLISKYDKNNQDAYKKKLSRAIDAFTKDLSETMPQSNLIQKTGEMLNVLLAERKQEIKISLKSYVEYLERYLTFMNLLLESETGDSINKELSEVDENSSDINSSLKRISSLTEMLEKEFRSEFEEIKKLMGKGELEKARAKFSELITKIRKKMADDLAKSMAMSQKISDEVKEKLDKMTKNAQKLLKSQELNILITDKGNEKEALAGQDEVNMGLSDLNRKTEKLFSEYPFVMFSLNSYAEAARLNGERALQHLQKKRERQIFELSKTGSQVFERISGFFISANADDG